MKSKVIRASVFSLAICFALFSIVLLFLSFYKYISIGPIISIILGLVLSVFIASIISYIFIYNKLKKYKQFTNDTSSIYNKKIKSYNTMKYKGSLRTLANNINNYICSNSKELESLKNNILERDTLINKLEQGIIVLDRNKNILYSNTITKNILNSGLVINNSIKDSVIFNSNIIPIYNDVIKSNKSSSQIIKLKNPNRVIEIYSIPLYQDSSKSNILVTLTDLTEMNRLKKMRDEFASNVTHELKTPLTSIIGFMELLKEKDRDEETRKYFYDIIYNEAQRLFSLIDDMLLLAQVENMNESALTQKCDIKSEIKESLSYLEILAKKRNITIEVNTENKLIIEASKVRIQQLLSNIIGNAIKYNIDNGKIFINAYRNRNKIIISIKDTGVGIAPENIDKIFERFYRSDTSRAAGTPGTGLGLAIVKDIITLYNGDIQVNSDIGKGSEFIITFPTSNR